MKAPYKIFNQTRMVEVQVYRDGHKIADTEWDEDLWIERGEDWYAMMSPQLRGKRIRVIIRNEWLKSRQI